MLTHCRLQMLKSAEKKKKKTKYHLTQMNGLIPER